MEVFGYMQAIEKYDKPMNCASSEFTPTGTFSIIISYLGSYCVIHSPQDKLEAEQFAKEYNELRNSPLIKALK